MPYEYRAPYEGCTRYSVAGLKHLRKIGSPMIVEGYLIASYERGGVDGKKAYSHERVAVHGTNGKARFGGFSWGYGGEGPHGLKELLVALGFTHPLAETVAFNPAVLGVWGNFQDAKVNNKVVLWSFENIAGQWIKRK